jgi:hypothetical protein
VKLRRFLRAACVNLLLVAGFLAGGLGIHAANLRLERLGLEARASGDVGPLPNGKALRVLSLGFERLVADLFWLRTVYYIGDEESHRAGYPAASRLAELVTDIDPHFTTVYVAMDSVLTTLRPEVDAAIRLLDKGLRYNDDYWRLHFLQGFNHFFYRRDYARAARLMRSAAERGGPEYLPLLAARLYAAAGSPETAMAFVQARLEGRYRDLWIHRDLAEIERAAARYRAAHGTAPERVDELVRAGLLAREPRDPAGGAYRIRAGRVECDLDYEPLSVHLQEEGT